MFPIRDTIPSRSVPLMTWGLIAVNLIVFLYELSLPPQTLEQFFYLFGMVPASYLTGGGFLAGGGVISFVTSMFIHGGLFHLVANMWTLWIFGDNVEDRMGKVRFLAFYLVCGLAAALVHLLTNPGSRVPTVGASGAIAGVLGAYFILYPRARVVTLIPVFFYPLFIELPAFFYLGFWFVSQILSGGLSSASNEAGGIAWWAHVGGFLAGLLLFRLFLSRRPSSRPPRHLILPRSGRRG